MHRFPGGTSPSFRWLHCIQGVTPIPGLLPSHPTILHSGAWLKYLRKRRHHEAFSDACPGHGLSPLPLVYPQFPNHVRASGRVTLQASLGTLTSNRSVHQQASGSCTLPRSRLSPALSAHREHRSCVRRTRRLTRSSDTRKPQLSSGSAVLVARLTRPSQPPRALGSHGPAGAQRLPTSGGGSAVRSAADRLLEEYILLVQASVTLPGRLGRCRRGSWVERTPATHLHLPGLCGADLTSEGWDMVGCVLLCFF